jgi:hypothetical protein
VDRFRGHKSGVAQDPHPVLEQRDEGLEARIVDMGRCAEPPHDAPLIHPQAELASHDPPVVRESLTTNLSRTLPFPNGRNQFETLAIHDPQRGGGRQEPMGPQPMGFEQAK